MVHGLYNAIYIHGPWVVQWNICPWLMDCTMVQRVCISHGPWVVQCYIRSWAMSCTMKYMPMTHGLYNPVYSHDTWIVHWFRGYAYPMIHGLYNPVCVHEPWVVQCHAYPWPMGCTILHIPMAHGLYNATYTHDHELYNAIYIHGPWVVQWHSCSWPMDCVIVLYSPWPMHCYENGLESIYSMICGSYNHETDRLPLQYGSQTTPQNHVLIISYPSLFPLCYWLPLPSHLVLPSRWAFWFFRPSCESTNISMFLSAIMGDHPTWAELVHPQSWSLQWWVSASSCSLYAIPLWTVRNMLGNVLTIF